MKVGYRMYDDTIRNIYSGYKKQLRECENNFDVLKFIAKMLIEIWWYTAK